MGMGHAQISGAGSSLARDVILQWSNGYGATVGGVRYEPIGSEAGVGKVVSRETDFGITDVPVSPATLRAAGLRQTPLFVSAVAVVANLKSLGGRPLKLNGDVLAEIYSGRVTNWNHNSIALLNPGVPLPDLKITPISRSDGSGQSYIFTSYLSRYNAAWRRKVGTTNKIPEGVGLSVKGGSAMLAALNTTAGGIGYEASSAAAKLGLTVANLRNAEQQFVPPAPANVREAVSRAKWTFDANEISADLDASEGAATYPMSNIVYAISPIVLAKGARESAPFITKAVQLGDDALAALGFLPLPTNAKAEVAKLTR
jgi:phosphate transport system substrate-binding protein